MGWWVWNIIDHVAYNSYVSVGFLHLSHMIMIVFREVPIKQNKKAKTRANLSDTGYD